MEKEEKRISPHLSSLQGAAEGQSFNHYLVHRNAIFDGVIRGVFLLFIWGI